MLIRYGYEITVTLQAADRNGLPAVAKRSRKTELRVPDRLFTTPIIATTTYVDTFGNRCRRLVAPPGDLTIWGDATIEDNGKIDPADFGAAEDLFGKISPGWGRVHAVCDFVHRHVKFDYLQARSTRTAYEAFNERVGVCRDFAHLAVTFCRCLNIPAR